jgi:hypothetical protein
VIVKLHLKQATVFKTSQIPFPAIYSPAAISVGNETSVIWDFVIFH